MSMNSPHESVKDIVGDVWKNNKPLALATLFILGVVIFILWKKSQASLIAPSGVAASTPAGVPANIKYGDITNITTTTSTSTSQSGGSSSVLAGLATIRTRDVRAPYDKVVAGGIPIRKTPGATAQSGLIPYGATVQLIGAAIAGTGNFGKTGSTTWYPVAGGYISAFDIASIK